MRRWIKNESVVDDGERTHLLEDNGEDESDDEVEKKVGLIGIDGSLEGKVNVDGGDYIRTNPFHAFRIGSTTSTSSLSDASEYESGFASVIHKLKGAIRMRPDFEYEDYTTIDWVRDTSMELKRKKNRLAKHVWYRQALDAVSGWVLLMAVGALCGIFAGLIDIGAEWLSDIREGVCKNAIWLSRKQCCWAEELAMEDQVCKLWSTWGEIFNYSDADNKNMTGGSFTVRYLFYIGWAILFALICTFLVQRISPYASGSGIPEVKTILSGFVIRGYFSLWTLFVKAIGMILAVAAGLSLGKEGPLVHVACCCGSALSFLSEKFRVNEAKKREILSAASAAGVAVAFGAPIGGVLFSLEEVSYFFPHKTMWRSFFAAMVGAIVLSNLNPFRSGKIVKFSVHFDYPWYWFELFPFMVIGIFGGLYGALFNRLNLWWCGIRKNTRLSKYPTTEVVMITFITALCSYPNMYTRLFSAEVIASLFSECKKESVNPICTHDINESIFLLLLACAFKAAITIFTFGIQVPSGLFIPTMFVGATFGRVVGIITSQIVSQYETSYVIRTSCPDISSCITPGLYAMIGAAAALGGVTRMTVSLVVIMFELTGGLTYILPLMLAILISKWVGDAFNKEGIYDRHIAFKQYPFLDNKHQFVKNTQAKHVMQPPHDSGKTPIVLPTKGLTIGFLEKILSSTKFIGFPVVDNTKDMRVIGYTLRKELAAKLEDYLETEVRDHGDICIFKEYVHESDEQHHIVHADCLDLSDCVHEDVFQVAATMPVSTVLQLFRRLGVRQALVIHEGRLVGILTKKDLIFHLHLVQTGQFDQFQLEQELRQRG
eukprot:m.102157 g.102157  ORF g.102157 m.102157 type:complete len:828 (-) comp9074_c0_seq3:1928-4411(-)